MNKKFITIGIPFLLSLLLSSLLFVEGYYSFESKMYDLLLHIKPEVEEQKELLLVNIDDPTITNINMYPISRDIFADGLILMKEMGADYVMLDIEFIDKSPGGINNQYLEEQIPDQFDSVFNDLSEQQTALFQAMASGQLPLDMMDQYLVQLKDYSEIRKTELLEEVNKIARDNDIYLGQAISWFGNVICTVNMMDSPDNTTPEELKTLTLQKVSLNTISTGNKDIFSPAVDIKPSITPVMTSSLNAGFPRVEIDSDGVRRRIDLIFNHQGELYPQLGFSALLQKMDVKELVLSHKSITMKDASSYDGTKKDIIIPLDRNGRMLINWPAKNFSESFRHISFINLYNHDRALANLIYNLKLMEAQGFLDAPFFTGETPLLSIYDYAELLKSDRMADPGRDIIEEYRSIREMFFNETEIFLDGEAEQKILEELKYYLTLPDLSAEQLTYFNDLISFIPEVFSESRSILDQIRQLREKMKIQFDGSMCVIGYSGTSTTDIGVNPFEEKYMNMGLYAAVSNTIMSSQFLDEAPRIIPILVTVLLTLLTVLIVSRMNPKGGIIVGIGILLLTEGFLILFFLLSGIYIPMITPGLSLLIAFILTVSANLLQASREKGFIRSAFAQYLSDDVIKDLIEDPSKLTLGGEEKHMTAIFTDVKGFSSISEKMTPQNLVSLLNGYLTEMSDLIMEEKGTIDKYEGDAIIAFYGAPQPYNDHAIKACRSAIRMKKAEKILNKKMIDEGKAPGPLLTRIGINTGDMVVGNMGTLQKMDYTMMGNAVNLAARLEGVNKQYATWIMISDSTYRETGDLFTVRKLDRVRVVGINEPVRLYELIDERTRTAENILLGLEHFHKGLELFENREWTQAIDFFKSARTHIEDDPTSEIYMKRCVKFSKEEPPKDWDGVFNLTQK
ncbi:MAG: hypothetical protein B6241_00165 [Spirochaetaceae bacterium 4572_59]|nr:MAG: hypothetical protein B6241_00165 [Spirochaetaceae bacterium 4572_59]